MGCSSGPDIIQDGLLCCLEAASKRSYTSGTTWYDLSNNNNATLVNANENNFSTDNGGIFNFDGTDEKVDFEGFRPNFDRYVQDFCIGVWFYLDSSSYSLALACERQGGMGWVWAVRGLSGNLKFGFWPASSGWVDLDVVVSAGEWHMAYLVYSASGTYVDIYLDGINIGSMLAGDFADSDDWSILRWDGTSSGYSNLSKIATYHVYNRALSADEIRQNYLSTKERFA